MPKRAWKQKSFEAKNQRGKYLAPLYDITHGHAVKLDCDNKVVAVSKVLSGLREGEAPKAEGQEEEENPDGEALFDEALRVRRRLRMKTSDPRRMDDGGGEKVAERIRLLRNLIMEEEERMLFSVKAGSSRRKTRLVVCGNYVAQNSEAEGDTFAGGTDITAIRLQVKVAMERKWTMSALDKVCRFAWGKGAGAPGGDAAAGDHGQNGLRRARRTMADRQGHVWASPKPEKVVRPPRR